MPDEYIEAENPNAGEAFPYCVRETAFGKTLSFDLAFHVMHWHDDVQFLYVEDGTIEVQTLEDLVTIRQGEGCFLGKDVVHCVRSTKTAHYYNFLYPADRLRFATDSPANDDIALVTSGTALPFYPLTAATNWERRALALLQELVGFTKETPDAFSCHVLLRLLALVLLLRAHAPLEHGKAAEDSNTLRTKQILRYIAAHARIPPPDEDDALQISHRIPPRTSRSAAAPDADAHRRDCRSRRLPPVQPVREILQAHDWPDAEGISQSASSDDMMRKSCNKSIAETSSA